MMSVWGSLLVAVFSVAWPWSAWAAVHSFFAPGDTKAIVLLQGFSAGQTDPDAHALYDAMAVPPMDAPGGKGKGIKTDPQDFNLSCVSRGPNPGDATCSFVVQRSVRSQISGATGHAAFALTGAEARDVYGRLAGSGATQVFRFTNSDGEIRVESSLDRFQFEFRARGN